MVCVCNVRLIARLNDNDYYRGRGIFSEEIILGMKNFSSEIIRTKWNFAIHKLRFPRSFVSLK